ncbi:MAG TPA: flagellar hook capping FlgD N-terminal domain-containing protein [Kineosporiaceae bacterium]
MTITYGPVGGIGSGAATTGTNQPATTGQDRIDQDTFLKLLVAQLKYQDPSSPTDPTQFLSQTAQFTMVEKLNQLADLNQKVYDASREQTASSMIGRTVTWTDVSGTRHTGTVSGVSVGAATPNLTVDGATVSLDAVSAVASATTPASATGSTPS